jgi:hypothetical protein
LNYDCRWNVFARTWLDENKNGIWDRLEPPLSDVTVKLSSIYEGKTDAKGEVDLSQPMAGFGRCSSDTIVEVDVVEPPGYRLTTSQVITGAWTNRERFQFGFARVSAAPTSTLPSISK